MSMAGFWVHVSWAYDIMAHNCDLCDAWLCEGVIYHTSHGIPSLMTTYGSPIFSTYKLLCPS
jgi:hypothetical protein